MGNPLSRRLGPASPEPPPSAASSHHEAALALDRLIEDWWDRYLTRLNRADLVLADTPETAFRLICEGMSDPRGVDVGIRQALAKIGLGFRLNPALWESVHSVWLSRRSYAVEVTPSTERAVPQWSIECWRRYEPTLAFRHIITDENNTLEHLLPAAPASRTTIAVNDATIPLLHDVEDQRLINYMNHRYVATLVHRYVCWK